MTNSSDQEYPRLLGARILSEANDLKRTPDALADELGLERDYIRQVIAGEAGIDAGRNVIGRMAETYPIRLSDLWIDPDDTDNGVRIMRNSESLASARIFQRKDRNETLTDYYEYRDTAMSRLGPFKPEWIQPIRIVADANADNPDVTYNNGHLMHQMTFFIGGVNFYWEVGGKKHCAEMNTGDSNYITPFVPHSFTSRDPDKPGLIIAVTYAGSVRRSLDDFALLGSEDADLIAGDLRQAKTAQLVRLKRHLANASLSPDAFARLLVDRGINGADARSFARGEQQPDGESLSIMADVLGLRVQDLIATAVDPDEDVVLKVADERGWRFWPDGNDAAIRLNPLAGSRHQPGLRAFHVEAVSDRMGGTEADMCHGLFEYIYNYGDHPIRLCWNDSDEAILAPGDSACVRPMVRHRFSLLPGETEPARFFLVRVPGQLDDTSLDEYARFATQGRHRVIMETKRWF